MTGQRLNGHYRSSPNRPYTEPGELFLEYGEDDKLVAVVDGKRHEFYVQEVEHETDLCGDVRVVIGDDGVFEFYPDDGEIERAGLAVEPIQEAARCR